MPWNPRLHTCEHWLPPVPPPPWTVSPMSRLQFGASARRRAARWRESWCIQESFCLVLNLVVMFVPAKIKAVLELRESPGWWFVISPVPVWCSLNAAPLVSDCPSASWAGSENVLVLTRYTFIQFVYSTMLINSYCTLNINIISKRWFIYWYSLCNI